MVQRVAPAWHATAQQFHSPLRWSSRSERGSIRVYPRRIDFSGTRTEMQLRLIESVIIVQRPVPWLSLAIDNAVLLLLITGGLTSTLALANPATWSFLVLINIAFCLMLQRVKWIDVEYRDESGSLEHAYFTDGSSFGMARALGGVERLSKAIVSGLEAGPGVQKQEGQQLPPSQGARCPACGASVSLESSRCPDCDISLR